MRMPTYLSPTSISLWTKDIEEFYLRYLSSVRVPREPQTLPMAIGSAFDAYVKNYLHEKLFGKAATAGSEYEKDYIFENQVEKHNWDWARENGEYLFNEYRKAGCLADLMLELGSSIGKVRFEFKIEDTIDGVPLLGKPDLFYINKEGARVVLDFKVNGYCSKWNTSPGKGFIKLRARGKGETSGYSKVTSHRDCALVMVQGVLINAAIHLEDVNSSWADQLSIYSWLLGEPVGSESVIVGIDQICGNPDHKNGLRFASHRLRISPEWQYNLLELAKQIWEIIQSGWIFREVNEKESVLRGELIEDSVACADSNDPFDQLIS